MNVKELRSICAVAADHIEIAYREFDTDKGESYTLVGEWQVLKVYDPTHGHRFVIVLRGEQSVHLSGMEPL